MTDTNNTLQEGVLHRQMSDRRQERLCRRRNGRRQEHRERCVVKGTLDVQTRRCQQRVTVDALFVNMVNMSVVGKLLTFDNDIANTLLLTSFSTLAHMNH